MRKTTMSLIAVLWALSFVAACGGSKSASESAKPAEKPTPAPTASAAVSNAEEEGVAVAKEILGVFDQAVAEAVELVKDKPAAADLQPKLDALFEKYKVRMAELNPKYLALREKDIRAFGAANGYLGENRGKHVFAKDNTLGEAIAYYNFQKGEKGIVDFLGFKIAALIDVAVQM